MQNNTPKHNHNTITRLKDATTKMTKNQLHALFMAMSIAGGAATYNVFDNIAENRILSNHSEELIIDSDSFHIGVDNQINNQIFKDNFLQVMRIYQEYFVKRNNPKMGQLHLEEINQAAKIWIDEISILDINGNETYCTSIDLADRSDDEFMKEAKKLKKGDIYMHNLEIEDPHNTSGKILVHTHYSGKLYNKDGDFTGYLHIRFQFPRLTIYIQEYQKIHNQAIHGIYVYNENNESIMQASGSEDDLKNYERVKKLTHSEIHYITYYMEKLENEIAIYTKEYIQTTEDILNEITLFLDETDGLANSLQESTNTHIKSDKAKSLVDKAKSLADKTKSLADKAKSLVDKANKLYTTLQNFENHMQTQSHDTNKFKSKIQKYSKEIHKEIKEMKNSLISQSSYFDQTEKHGVTTIREHKHMINQIEDEKGNRYLLTFEHPSFHGKEYHIDFFTDIDKILEQNKTNFPMYITLIILLLLSIPYTYITFIRTSLEKLVKEKTAELAKSKNMITTIIDTTAEAIFGLDLEGNCTLVNNSCLKMLDYDTKEELIGKNMHNLIHHTNNDGSHHTIDDCNINKSIHKQIQSHVDNEVLWKKDGTSFDAEYWSHPIFDDGVVKGGVVTFLDITERKIAENELKENEEKYRLIVENIKTGVGFIDIKTATIKESNTYFCDFMETELQDIIGCEENECICNKDIKKLTEWFIFLATDGSILNKETQITTMKGNKKTALISLEIGKTANRLFFSITDISEIKSIENTLIKSRDKLNQTLIETNALAELSESIINIDIDIKNICNMILKIAKDTIKVEHGFVATIDPITKDLIAHTISDMMGKSCHVHGHSIIFPKGKHGYGGLWGHALNTGKTMFTNNPKSHKSTKEPPK